MSGPARLAPTTILTLAEKLPFRFLFFMFSLTLVRILKVILSRCVVGSHGGALEEDAEVLGEVWILNDAETLVLVELTALVVCEHGCIIQAQEL